MRLKRVGAYVGVDATAPSLHLGHLVAFMPIFWMYLHNYTAYTLIGSSTAKVGDPTGRTESRPVLSRPDLVQNLVTIHYQLKALWANVEVFKSNLGYEKDWACRRAIVNNNTWWNKLPMMEVLQRLGSRVRLGPMLGRDNVKTRIDDGSGMSFAEFCYPLMQAWDWCELLTRNSIQMQVGGSDQYGNILTGAHCVKEFVQGEPDPNKKLPDTSRDQPFGFTVPLLTDASGAKFGKSAGNALWLDPFKTSPYNLYGYLVRQSDEDVGRLLKLLTFLPLEQIEKAVAEHMEDPPKRVAQHLLAHQVLCLVHGNQVANRTQLEHRQMYGKASTPLNNLDTLQDAEQPMKDYEAPREGTIHANNRPRTDMVLPRSLLEQSLARITYAAGLATSVSDANRVIKAGGIYYGGSPGQQGSSQTGMKVGDLAFTPAKNWSIDVNQNFLIEDKFLLLRKGKHNLRLIRFISDEDFAARNLTYPGQPFTGAFRKARELVRQLGEQDKAADGSEGEEEKPSVQDLPVDEKLWRMKRFRKMVGTMQGKGLIKDDDAW